MSILSSVKVESKEGFFKGQDGLDVYYKIWSPVGTTPVAKILAMHGLGEHINRYDHVFTYFAENGIIVKGLDYRGHGRTYQRQLEEKVSPSAIKGHALFSVLFEDLLLLNALDQSPDEGSLPAFVFGHSLGGLIALAFTSQNIVPNLKGVISQAPAMRPTVPIPAYAKVALKFTWLSIVSRYTDANSLNLTGLCTDPAVVAAYKADPLVHDRISLGLLNDILQSSKLLFDHADKFRYPLFMAQSSSDLFTSFAGTLEFYTVAGSTDKKFSEYKDLGHECK